MCNIYLCSTIGISCVTSVTYKNLDGEHNAQILQHLYNINENGNFAQGPEYSIDPELIMHSIYTYSMSEPDKVAEHEQMLGYGLRVERGPMGDSVCRNTWTKHA